MKEIDLHRTGFPAPPDRLVLGLVVTLVAALGGCGGGEEPEPEPTPAPPEPKLSADPLPGALYHTELTFVGSGEVPSVLHLRFDNRTDSASIHLRYRGWFGGREWSQILELADSLPVPRAAWRILPSGPVRVMAGEGGDPSSVLVALPEGRLRLDSRGAVATWNSSAGQRESLRLAELLDRSGAETGLLLARQSARRLDEAPSEGREQLFLVTDTTGAGILIMRESTAPDAPVTAWTWFEDSETAWDDGLLLALAAAPGSPGRWSFELPEAGLLGEIRGNEPLLAERSGDLPGFEIFRVEAALVLDGQSWTMRGVGLQEMNVD
jgi:hypothetical protein